MKRSCVKLPPFDKTLIKEALVKTPDERFREACELYEFYEAVTPFPYKRVLKSFSSFAEYDKWRKKQNDPRFW
jgi:hypothetical protein